MDDDAGREPGPDDGGLPPVPFLADLLKLLGGGDRTWEGARQMALSLATEGQPEPNVDPLVRMRIEELARVAELHLARSEILPAPAGDSPVPLFVVTRAEWAHHTLLAYRPLFERLAQALAAAPPPAADPSALGDPSDALGALFSQMMGAITPIMLGVATGSMVGHLARRSLGGYDLPLPRPESDPLFVVPANLAALADDWSLPPEELQIWVCAQELAWRSVLAVPHVRQALEERLAAHAGGYRSDAGVLGDRLGDLDPTSPTMLTDVQALLGDPEVLLGAMRSDQQRELAPHLDALVAVLVGAVDLGLDAVGVSLLGPNSRVAEALRRHRVETDPSDRFIERLFGLQLGTPQVDRGRAFAEGVIEREGPSALARLWTDATALPTPAEVDAPGLWLARLELA